MRPALKQGLHWFGCTLAIAGVMFVIMHLYNFSADIDVSRFGTGTWLGIIAFSWIYGLANLMLAMAWWNLLEHFQVTVSGRWAIKTYGMTQLAKYTPGNIFHLAGRQAVGMAAGLPGWPMAKSAVGELGLLSVAGAPFAILVLPRWLPLFPLTWAALAFACTISTIALAVWQYCGASAVRAFGWHCGFLAVSGLLFAGLVGLLADNLNSLLVIELCGAYILAWLIGLVTPGAPAGAGVRELALLFFFKGVIGETDLLMAVILGRVITVVGDLGFFGFTSLLKKRDSTP